MPLWVLMELNTETAMKGKGIREDGEGREDAEERGRGEGHQAAGSHAMDAWISA